jgi:hypothetical protein
METILVGLWFIGVIGFTYIMIKMGNAVGRNQEADWDIDEN